jgi:hypothetical protein
MEPYLFMIESKKVINSITLTFPRQISQYEAFAMFLLLARLHGEIWSWNKNMTAEESKGEMACGCMRSCGVGELDEATSLQV